ncbi:MAG: hypothetical protein QM621_03115 [Aeromicrobium sp.]|uniref:hypothetical protein n=1 Tax=Aeromicrobium sp. TaxID=1871063 RepID=UPI0039E5129F
MRTPVRRLLTVTVTATLALAMTACGGDAGTKPRATPTGVVSDLMPGACLEAQGDATVLGDTEITEEAIVDCGRPHIYEVLAVQDVPGQYIAGTTATEDDQELLRAALEGERAEPTQITFASFARAYCDIALQGALGLDSDTELDGADLRSLQFAPLARTQAPYAAIPAEGWTEQPVLACVNRFTEASSTPAEEPVEPVTGSQTALWLTQDFPVADRLCLMFDAAGRPADAPCASTHDGEYLAAFDATAVLDEEELAASDSGSPLTDEVQEKLDAVCEDALALLMDSEEQEAVVGRAVRDAEGWGAGGLANMARCYATPEDSAMALPAGSVIGWGDEELALVERD